MALQNSKASIVLIYFFLVVVFCLVFFFNSRDSKNPWRRKEFLCQIKTRKNKEGSLLITHAVLPKRRQRALALGLYTGGTGIQNELLEPVPAPANLFFQISSDKSQRKCSALVWNSLLLRETRLWLDKISHSPQRNTAWMLSWLFHCRWIFHLSSALLWLSTTIFLFILPATQAGMDVTWKTSIFTKKTLYFLFQILRNSPSVPWEM